MQLLDYTRKADGPKDLMYRDCKIYTFTITQGRFPIRQAVNFRFKNHKIKNDRKTKQNHDINNKMKQKRNGQKY